MNKKVLVLVQDANAYYFPSFRSANIDICSVYRKETGIRLLLSKIVRKFGLPLRQYFYEDWLKQIRKYSKIIVFDVVCCEKHLLSDLVRYSQATKYIYFWNIMRNNPITGEVLKWKDRYCIYSYDELDCKQYGVLYNTIMYDKRLKLTPHKIVSDAVYIGFLKNRSEALSSIYRILINEGLKPRFIVVSYTKMNGQQLPFGVVVGKYISYNEYLDIVSESNAIVDIVQKDQVGFSMRVMEAIFLNKKLISDNIYLVDAAFYHPNNIYIIGKVGQISLKEFMALPYIPVSQETRNYYSMEAWVERFR